MAVIYVKTAETARNLSVVHVNVRVQGERKADDTCKVALDGINTPGQDAQKTQLANSTQVVRMRSEEIQEFR